LIFQRQVENYKKRVQHHDAQDAERKAEESERSAGACQQRINTLQRHAEVAKERVLPLHRSLAKTEQVQKQSESDSLASTHWAIRREEIEVTGPELGAGGWANYYNG